MKYIVIFTDYIIAGLYFGITEVVGPANFIQIFANPLTGAVNTPKLTLRALNLGGDASTAYDLRPKIGQ